MERRNNFEELEEETLEQYGSPPSEVKRNIKKNIGLFHFFGNIVDLFFPKVLKIFSNMAGADDKGKTKNQTDPPNLKDENQS